MCCSFLSIDGKTRKTCISKLQDLESYIRLVAFYFNTGKPSLHGVDFSWLIKQYFLTVTCKNTRCFTFEENIIPAEISEPTSSVFLVSLSIGSSVYLLIIDNYFFFPLFFF